MFFGEALFARCVVDAPCQASVGQYWSTLVNGVVAITVMAIMMWPAAAPRVMGDFTVNGWVKGLGWMGTAVMAAAIAAMPATGELGCRPPPKRPDGTKDPKEASMPMGLL